MQPIACGLLGVAKLNRRSTLFVQPVDIIIAPPTCCGARRGSAPTVSDLDDSGHTLGSVRASLKFDSTCGAGSTSNERRRNAHRSKLILAKAQEAVVLVTYISEIVHRHISSACRSCVTFDQTSIHCNVFSRQQMNCCRSQTTQKIDWRLVDRHLSKSVHTCGKHQPPPLARCVKPRRRRMQRGRAKVSSLNLTAKTVKRPIGIMKHGAGCTVNRPDTSLHYWNSIPCLFFSLLSFEFH